MEEREWRNSRLIAFGHNSGRCDYYHYSQENHFECNINTLCSEQEFNYICYLLDDKFGWLRQIDNDYKSIKELTFRTQIRFGVLRESYSYVKEYNTDVDYRSPFYGQLKKTITFKEKEKMKKEIINIKEKMSDIMGENNRDEIIEEFNKSAVGDIKLFLEKNGLLTRERENLTIRYETKLSFTIGYLVSLVTESGNEVVHTQIIKTGNKNIVEMEIKL